MSGLQVRFRHECVEFVLMLGMCSRNILLIHSFLSKNICIPRKQCKLLHQMSNKKILNLINNTKNNGDFSGSQDTTK